MVLEDFPQFSEWIGPGLLLFGGILLAATLLGLFIGYVVASFRHGPGEAFYRVAQVIGGAIPDFLYMSPRRIWAIAGLAIKESLRRRVILVAFCIFAATLLFGSWFMDAGSENPDQIYLNTVMWGTQLLVLVTGLLISAFSLPEDIQNKTIYTVVTKPVRPTEIVIGRILGFGLLGTGLLALMGLISFLFVWRSLAHDHQVAGATQTIAEFSEIDPGTVISRISGTRVSENAISEAFTTTDSGHRHRLEVIGFTRPADEPYESPDVWKSETAGDLTTYYRVICQPFGNHTHRVTVDGADDDARISLGPAIGNFRARVPVYADSLKFIDREGNLRDKGINVGKEWSYRGYIDGGTPLNRSTLSKGIFKFDNFWPSRFRSGTDVIPLEMTLGVFRTYKGDIQKRVIGGIQFESLPDNPDVDNKFISEVQEFESNEYQLQTLPVTRKLVGRVIRPDGSTVSEGEYDLFDEFAANGNLQLTLTCRDINQHLGVAKADVYFRATDEVYWINFIKGYVGIWCQLMIIIAMGVAISTVLSSPIVMLGVVVMMIIGFFTPFIRSLTEEGHDGGGPIESLIRVVTQKNVMVDLETGVLDTVIQQTDALILAVMVNLTYLAPNFSSLDFSQFLTYGYAIDSQRMIVALATTAAFCCGLTLLGYFLLKTREIAK